jgi:hypothetical protein
MTTQYTPILKLALPVQGELSGTWGDVVNDNITSMVEQAIAGRSVIDTWSANSHVLTTANGTTAESRAAMLSLTDSGTALTGAGSVICPALSKVYIVKNGTAQVITVKTAAGSGIAVPVGKTMLVYCDGTNVLEAVDHVVTLSAGTLTITGLTTFASLKGTGAVTVTNILDEDNMASDSATALATQQSIKAYVDSQVGTVDTLSEILAIGNTSGANNLIIDNGQAITTNTINETTAASGVTIDSVLLKDDGVNATNLEITNLKANDGTSAGSIADSTGIVTLASSVLTTADINGGTIDGTVIGGSTAAAGTFTTGQFNTSLNVDGTVTADGLTVDVNADSDSVATITSTATANNTQLRLGTNGDDSVISGTGGSNGALAFKVFGTERFRIVADGSLSTPTLGTSNVRFGVNAGNSIIAGGNYNTVVGDEAGTAITTGDYNVALGYLALPADTLGSRSTAIGVAALEAQNFTSATDAYNTAVGFGAGSAVTTATRNTLIGGLTGDAITTGSFNVAVGYTSLGATTTGVSNVALGDSALNSNTTGSTNTAVGQAALGSNTTADDNTAVGYSALTSNTTGGQNTALGVEALKSNTTASYNTALGRHALYLNTTGAGLTAVGHQALNSNTTGNDNVAVGGYSTSSSIFAPLYDNTTGSSNVGIGVGALRSNTTADSNTAVGYQAGYSNTTGAQSVFVGQSAGYTNTTGTQQVFVGLNAGYSATGNYNTFVGAASGYSVSTGAKNTIIGSYNGNQGGLDIRTASNHIVLSDGDGNPRGIFDGSGNWLVGKTSSDSNVEGAVLYGDSATGASAAFTSDGIRTIIANRKTDDGEIISIRKDGTIVGSIGSRSGVVSYIVLDPRSGVKGAALIGGSVDANNGIINPGKADGDIADDAISLGGSSSRFKDLYLSGGVYLGGTGAANLLDDYEEGTFTATLLGSTTNPTVTYAEQVGVYTKIGNLVTVKFSVGTTANTGGVGNIWIGGLPFTQNADAGKRGTGCIAGYNYVMPTDGYQIVGEGNVSQTYFALLVSASNAAWANATWASATNSAIYFRGEFTYRV